MKLQTKKKFARELLLLLFAIVTGLVAFSCTYLYNLYHRTKSQNISKEITTKVSIAGNKSQKANTQESGSS